MIVDAIIIAMIALSSVDVDTIKKEPVKIDMKKLREASDRAASKANEVTKEELYKFLNDKCIIHKQITKQLFF